MEKAEFMEDSEEHAKKEWLKIKIEYDQAQSQLGVLQGENQRLRNKYKDMVENMKAVTTNYEERISEYVKRINLLDRDMEEKNLELEELKKENKTIVDQNKVEVNEIKEANKKEVYELQQKVGAMLEEKDSLEGFSKQKEQLIAKVQQMESELKAEKRNRQEHVNQLERDKIKATEKLRKEMLHKIKETKANLLALNDEQLQTTTRLTILQNHQLTTELEYQSKQTEQLVYKNDLMKKEIEQLKRDIQIHKEVEKELAKRSHFCQKVIKKLKQQVADLTEKSKGALSPQQSHTLLGSKPSLHNRGLTMSYGSGPMTTRNKNKPMLQSIDQMNSGNEDLISFLEQKLEEVEKNLNRTKKEYEFLQQDYLELRNQTSNSGEKYKRAALLLTEYLDDILTQTPNILENNNDMHLNLEKVKTVPMQNLAKDDKVALVLVLLKQLQPYLSAHNLQTSSPDPSQGSPFNKGSGLHRQHHSLGSYQTMPSSQYMSVPQQLNNMGQPLKHSDDNIAVQNSLSSAIPSTAGSTAEVDALQSILNNINVQTSRSNAHMTLDSDRLPPI